MPFLYIFASGTLLINYPDPLPSGFSGVSAPVKAAWRPAAAAQTPFDGLELRRVTLNGLVRLDPAHVFGGAVHEAFHRFQRSRAREGRRFGRGENNVAAMAYPVFRVDQETESALEGPILKAALGAPSVDSARRLTLLVQRIGYGNQSLAVTVTDGMDVTVDVTLDVSPTRLDDVVVTGSVIQSRIASWTSASRTSGRS